MTGVKATTWDWDEIQTHYTADDNLYILSEREIGVLLTAIIPATWRTRWFSRPTDFELIEDFVGTLNDRLMTPVNLCELIADCINDPNSPANQAVRDIAGTGNGYPANQNPPLSQREKDLLLDTNPTCDLDKLYGQCVFLVQTTNRLITDFLEQFEAASNITEILTIIGSSPVLNESGAEALAGYAAYLQEVLAENYASQYTQDFENEIVCGLFCIAKDTCSLQIAQVADYLAGQAGVSLDVPSVIVDIVAALAGVPLSGTYVVWSMFTLCWKGLELANMFLDGVGDNALSVSLAAGAGEPSDDWMLLCEDCTVPAGLLFDFTAANQGFALVNSRGAYLPPFATTRFQEGSPYYIAVHITKQMPSGATITKVELDITMIAGTQQTTPYSRFQVIASNGTTTKTNQTIQSGQLAAGDHTISYTFSTPISFLTNEYLRVDRWLYDNANSVTSGYAVAKINKMRLYISGTIPTNWGGVEFFE